jgi:hypothetical protein
VPLSIDLGHCDLVELRVEPAHSYKEHDNRKVSKMIRIIASGAIAMLAIACTDRTGIAVERNELGIARVDIERSSTRGEQLSIVRGLDVGGEEVVALTIRRGRVLYSSEVGVIEPTWSDGTELVFSQPDHDELSLVSPDREPHAVPEPYAPYGPFSRLAAISAEIEHEIGVRITPSEVVSGSADEAAYSIAANCSGLNSWFPSSQGPILQCCRENSNTTYHRTSTSTLVSRSYYHNACRTSSGGTDCGDGLQQCYYGPSTAHTNWQKGTGAPQAMVFFPGSNHSSPVCGWDARNGEHSPEPFISQDTYGGITASNTCTGCSGGRPSGTGCNQCATGPECPGSFVGVLRFTQDIMAVCNTHGGCTSGGIATGGCTTGISSAIAVCVTSPSNVSFWCSSSSVENGTTVYTNCH